MRFLMLFLFWLASSHALFAKERTGGYSIDSRAPDGDGDDFFPFPANGSSTEGPGPLPTEAMNDTASSSGRGSEIPRFFIEHGCTDRKKFMITDSWKEAKRLALAQSTIKEGYNYAIPHTQWLGDDWNSAGSWIPWIWNFRKLIGNNFRRLGQLFSNDAQSHEYIYWYCQDYGEICTDKMTAYPFSSPGRFWSNHYTTFCDKFYKAPALRDVLARHKDDLLEQKIMENFAYNRADTMFHEIWHYVGLVSSPTAHDYAYGPEEAWNLSKKQGTNYAYVNADSYTLDAMAVLVQQYYGSAMSPIPWEEYKKLYPADAAAASGPEFVGAFAYELDQVPPHWNGPLTTDDKPDMSIWEEVNIEDLHTSPEPDASPISSPSPSPSPASPPPPPPPDQNACHGISGDYWVMSRDLAIENVKDFCGQSDKTKEYNGDTVNDLRLSVKKLDDDSKGPTDAPDCFGRFQRSVIDGCDGGDYLNNPFNYKFGSTLTTGDGWEYKMEPLSEQVNAVNCDVSYKFAFDAVEIRGKNFPDAKLGVNGERLHDELSGCGALTKWHFERTPDNCCFQWFASAQLPIGTKACVGRAVMSAGGSDDGNCHGAWKASGNVSNIDSWPGYGYEGRHVFSDGSI